MENNNKTKVEQGVNVVDLFMYLLSKWKWYLLSVFICCSLAYYYYAKSPLIYFRQAMVIIKDPSNKNAVGGLDRFDYINKVNLANELLQFKSKNIMREVVRRLDADVNYQQKIKLRYVELYSLSPVKVTFENVMPERGFSFDVTILDNKTVELSNIEGIPNANGSFKLNVNKVANFHGEKIRITPTSRMDKSWIGERIRIVKSPLTAAANYFRGNIGIRQEQEDGSIITLSMKDLSGYRAGDILNMLVTVYNEDALNDKNQVSINSSNFINERLKIIERELGGVENELLDYKISNDIVSLGATTNQYIGKSSAYADEVVQQEVQMKVAQYVKNYLADPSKESELIPANSGIGDNEIENQIAQYNELKLRRDRLMKESSAENPIVEEIDKTMHNLRQSVIRSVDNQIVNINVKRQDAMRQQGFAQGKLGSIPIKEKGLLSIQRQQQIKEQLYLFLLNKREENALARAMADNNARVIDPADGSSRPIDPDRNKIMLLGGLLGLAFPTMYFLFLMFMDTKIRSRKDLKDVTAIPFLGEIPQDEEFSKASKKGLAPALIEMDEGMLAESFRILRTNMSFMAKKTHMKVITFTSFNEGAGKTFTARNLAGALAHSKKHVVIVDLDIRKRTLSHLFTAERHVGVTNYLAYDNITVDEIIHKGDGGENLDIIYAGHSAPNPAELLLDNRLEELMEELRGRYDYVIVDNVPVGIIADAAISNRISDLTIFVLRAGKLDRRQLPDLEALYNDGKLKNMALVLNGVDPKYRGYGYRYGYGYGYGYGYKYGYGYGYSDHHGKHRRSKKKEETEA